MASCHGCVSRAVAPWARFARLTQPWHTIIPQPGSLKAWPCSTSNRCPAGPASRRSSPCWTAAGLDRRRVGRIELRGTQAVVEVPDGWEARLVKALDGQLFGDRRVRAWTSGPPSGQPRARERPFPAAGAAAGPGKPGRGPAGGRAGPATLARRGRADRQQPDRPGGRRRGGRPGRPLPRALGRRGRGPLPWTRLDVGSPVVLSPHAAKAEQSAPRRGLRAQRAVDLRGPRSACPRTWATTTPGGSTCRSTKWPSQRQRAALEQAAQCPRRPLGHPARRAARACGSRSSASIPRSGRWTASSTPCSARPCSSPSRPATWA